MSFIKWAFGIPLIFLCIIPFLRVNVRITYQKNGRDDELIVIFSFLMGLVSFKIEASPIRVFVLRRMKKMIAEETGLAVAGKTMADLGLDIDSKGIRSIIERTSRQYRQFGPIINYLISRISIIDLVWDTSLGWGDAAITGISVGILWNIKTMILNLMNACLRRVVIKRININPDFRGVNLSIYFDCILSFKIGHAIVAGASGIFARLKDGEKYERAPD